MANKWAIQNGNWSDGSTWNDGVVPTANDDVWLNGKTVTFTNSSTYTLELKSLHTDSSEFALEGGTISSSYSTFTISSDITLGNFSTSFLSGSYVVCRTINGNIHIKGNQVFQYTGSNGAFIINGNFIIDGVGSFYSQTTNITLTINGNVIVNSGYIANDATLTINGNIDARSVIYHTRVRSLVVNGDASFRTNMSFYGSARFNNNLYIYECTLTSDVFYLFKVHYYGRDANFGIDTPTIQVISRQDFEIHYMWFENPDYPLESNVANGIVYDYGEKIGTLETPPPSVVLEGYQYGDKIGTLKTVPDNVAIVNLTEQEVNRVKNCATVSTVQKCFEDFKEE